jgi:hypothetical protein
MDREQIMVGEPVGQGTKINAKRLLEHEKP